MKRLLVVEDEKALRDVFVLLLRTQGYEVHEAENGQAALERLAEVEPEIILLDILMPVMGGIEFLEKADMQRTHPETKVLVLSNLSDQKTIDHVMRLGATKYVLKAGVSPSELVEAVRNL